MDQAGPSRDGDDRPNQPATATRTPSAQEKTIGAASGSCVPYFDALWFCYSPVHQMKEYYRYGTVDDCSGHWGTLMNCLKTKTTRYKNSVPEDPNAGRHPLWELRTPQQAAEFWGREFGKLSGEGPQAAAAAAAAAEAAAEASGGGAAEGEAPPADERRSGMV